MKLLMILLSLCAFLTACSSSEEKYRERQEEAREQYDESMKEAQEDYREDQKDAAEDMIEDSDGVEIDREKSQIKVQE